MPTIFVEIFIIHVWGLLIIYFLILKSYHKIWIFYSIYDPM